MIVMRLTMHLLFQEQLRPPQGPGEDIVPGRVSAVVPLTKDKVMQLKLVKVKAPTRVVEAPAPAVEEKPLQPQVVFPGDPRRVLLL